ncbi:glycerophosphodiester phosphodiesterase [Paenibacillus sp. GCM10027626]|uniref:glycerophosphodiester phosphodiesterase n=1 Tax=Paenibacillus sp. GCM10027626 TaxID=3273411 RepID=UPI00363034AE
MKKPLVIAHRGCAGEAPENTLAAFKLAMEQGCDAIELDVHFSKDGEIIVCHDHTIDRTSDGSGAIHELTVQEIQQADAGRWFDERYAGERIPLLSEVFELVPPSIMINVEVKDLHGEAGERRLVQFLRETNRVQHVVISSFNHELLVRLKQQEPELKIGMLYHQQVESHHGLAEQLGAPVFSLHPDFKLLDKAAVADAVDRGLEVYAWTVNSEEDMKLVVGLGVTGVITDFPGRLNKLLSVE